MAEHELLQTSEHQLVVMEDYADVQPGFNEQYEELQKNLVFTPSNLILWYECPICKRKSATKERLTRHIEAKHSVKASDDAKTPSATEILPHQRPEPFKCSLCPFACTTNADLMRHSKKHKGVKPYSCEVCGKQFSQKGNLKPHMLRHSGESPFKCSICPRAFNHKTSYKKHMEDHANPKNHACSICHVTFATIEQKNSHEQNKHSTEEVDCIVCGVILNSALGLKMHIAQMHPDLPGASELTLEKKWACQICNKRFSTKAYLIVHHKIHSGEKPFKCDLCDYCAVSRDSVKKHTERSHGQAKKLSCNLCEKTFTYYSHKKAHMLRHYNLKPFNCTLCSRSFLLKRHLTDHLRVHKGEPSFRCEKCDVAYVLPDSLRKHNDLHLSSPLGCHICQKQFWITGRYNKHMMMHRRQFNGKVSSMDKPHKCHLCSKSFKLKRFLTKHLENGCSETVTNFECSECSEVFTNEKAVKQHMRAYHNLKEYSCFVCAEGFKRIRHLMEHIEDMHPNCNEEDMKMINKTIKNDKISGASHKHRGFGNGLNRVRNTNASARDCNEKITLVPLEDSVAAKNVLVIDEHALGPDVRSIKLEASEVTYECYTCREVCSSYEELIDHQAKHEDDFTLPLEHSITIGAVKEEDQPQVTEVAFDDSFGQSPINETIRLDLDKIKEMEGEENEDETVLEEELEEEFEGEDENGENEEDEGLDREEVSTWYECGACQSSYASYEECEKHFKSVHSSGTKSAKSKLPKRKMKFYKDR